MKSKKAIEKIIESSRVKLIGTEELIREYEPGPNRHWFDRSTMEVFQTKIDQAFEGIHGIYFVASHSNGQNGRYVKVHYLSRGAIKTVKKWPDRSTINDLVSDISAARQIAREMAGDYPLPVDHTDVDLVGDILGLGDSASEKIGFIWQSLDKESFIERSMIYGPLISRLNLSAQLYVLVCFLRLLENYGLKSNNVPDSVLRSIHDWVLANKNDSAWPTPDPTFDDFKNSIGRYDHGYTWLDYT